MRAARHPRAAARKPLAARANLARWTGKAADAAGAREQYAALLPVIERVLGAEHPQTPEYPRQPRVLDQTSGTTT